MSPEPLVLNHHRTVTGKQWLTTTDEDLATSNGWLSHGNV
jgi:hypothetical protein